VSRLVDTSIRLLSQEPFVGRISTARILRLAEELAMAIAGAGSTMAAIAAE